MHFAYVIEKIKNAEILEFPFRHLELDDLFTAEDFQRITRSPEIKATLAKGDEDLFAELYARQYRIIDFPGCTSDPNEYIKWHRQKSLSHKINTACEGFGVVMRLATPASPEVQELQAFFTSPEFVQCLARKFDIDARECNYDAGIQKYLDGYEISPHPDIRRKALTFMVNINPNPNADAEQHHTSYLKFKPRWSYVQQFWSGNPDTDRCWVPWDWCEPVKQQVRNNSIVIFSPGNDTLHAVKANYDHRTYQRTQLYGNLWLKESPRSATSKWEDYLIATGSSGVEVGPDVGIKASLWNILPPGVRNVLERVRSTRTRKERSPSTHVERIY